VQAGGIPTPRLDEIEPRRLTHLTRKQRWGLLVFLVGLPYIRTKAQQYFETLRNEDDSASPETTVSLLVDVAE
jgi:peroxin-12